MTGKRKVGPGGSKGGQAKKIKGSHQGRWQTPHQKAKLANLAGIGSKIEAGDVGIWVTCQRKLEKKAMNEMMAMCDMICERLYGIPPPKWDDEVEDEEEKKRKKIGEESDEDDEDIEAAIKKELAGMKPGGSDGGTGKPLAKRRGPQRTTFLTVDLKCESVFFIRTFEPVRPVELVLAICEEAARCGGPRERKVRYVNRLTPVVKTAKATEVSLVGLARRVLGESFKLREREVETEAEAKEVGEQGSEKVEVAPELDQDPDVEFPPHTYAIRTTRRNHNTLTSETAVQRIAGQISYPHRVNLTKPDQMILVELFRNIAGVSVVKGVDFERLKKFNLDSIYKMVLEGIGKTKQGIPVTGEATVGETAETEKGGMVKAAVENAGVTEVGDVSRETVRTEGDVMTAEV